jgi:hypothetical protein
MSQKPTRGARRGVGEKVLIVLETFTGLTGGAGGALLMARPDGSLLQMAPAALSMLARTSPFQDFFVPGLLLAGIVGGGMLGAAALLFRQRPHALEAAIVAGAALIIFEVVEYAVIGFMPLQALEAAVGVAVMSLAAYRRLTGMRPPQHAARRRTALDLGSGT